MYLNDLRIVRGAQQAAIYDFSTGNVYAVNESGARIIELLRTEKTKEEIAEEISRDEGVDLSVISSLVNGFIGELNEFALIRQEMNTVCGTDHSTCVDHRLREVWIELTARCNERCLHCYASAGKKREPDLTTDVWLRIIDQLGKIGCRHLQLTGGEPFLRRDLWRIVDAALAIGTEVEIYSNLTLCTPDDVAQCKGRVSIATTLLGPNAEIHDHITKLKGGFTKTTSAIRSLVNAQVPVRVSMIIMAQNEKYVEETLAFIESLGVQHYGTDNMRFVGRGAENQAYAASNGTNRRPKVTTSQQNFEYNQFFNPCLGHKLAIQPDGTLIPCIFMRTMPVGNILDESVDALIEKEKVQKVWRMPLDQIETCKDCEFRYACQDCRPLALYEGGGLYAKAPRCNYNPYEGFWSK